MLLKKLLSFFFLIQVFNLVVLSPESVFAQAPEAVINSVAFTILLPEDVKVIGGELVSGNENQYQLAKNNYAKDLVGVIVVSPIAVVEPEEFPQNGHYVVSQGRVSILVTDQNGKINIGDWITSSSLAGYGMRATEPGWVIGRAMQNWGSDNAENKISIIADLNIHYEMNPTGEAIQGDQIPLQKLLKDSLKDLFVVFQLSAKEDPGILFRYILAAIVFIGAILFGYLSFGRVARSGVEAIGRNPLAKQTIMFGIVVNTILAGAVIFIGMVVAYYIIRL